MPGSQQNKPEPQPSSDDEMRWKRELTRGRLPAHVRDAIKTAARSAGTRYVDQDQWRRELEHGRLSALAMPQSLIFSGPGAAPAAAIAADEAKSMAKALAGSQTEKELIKAKAILATRNWMMGLLRNWIACWVFIPAVFAHMILFNEKLKSTAAKFKEASRMSLKPPKTPNEAIKMQMKNITWVLMGHWMQWAAWTCLWYGLLFLVITLIYFIYLLIKCAGGLLC